jgi:hypothetical protein
MSSSGTSQDNNAQGVQPFLDVLNAGVNAYEQIKLSDLNAKRVNAGLPALSPDQVGIATANLPDAPVSPAPSINWWPWIIGGIAVILLLRED